VVLGVFSVSLSQILPRLRIITNQFEMQEDTKTTFWNAPRIFPIRLIIKKSNSFARY
jgi:hypothetical protein